MAAGPWFTVQSTKDTGWFDFGTAWFSDGGKIDGPATIQLRWALEEPKTQASNQL